ncbi:hypothetical protein [Metabacillus fastidiosus]|uniref:hypothetical protein n=1 Tax=Metabacillus fastidiosus TaxID=1458 RepID=UPI002E1AC62E|nr:hypothetical protein [Metabacillus fastidiosus]
MSTKFQETEQFIMALEKDEGIEVKVCCDAITGKRDERIYQKAKACSTAEELKEVMKDEKVRLLLIRSKAKE